jgi:hypothetical protein
MDHIDQRPVWKFSFQPAMGVRFGPGTFTSYVGLQDIYLEGPHLQIRNKFTLGPSICHPV